MSNHRRIVVTGMGVVSPLGCSVERFWDRLIAGASGIRRVERFSTDGFDVCIGGECLDFRLEEFLDRRAEKRLDRFSQFAMHCANQAVRDAGLDFSREDPYRVATHIGSGMGGLQELEDQHSRLVEKGPTKVSAFTIPKLMSNAACGNISMHFGLKGVSQTVATACASATNAMGDAFLCIRSGMADVVVTGGTEAALTPLGLAAFASMKALSARNDEPARASRPFDRDRDGFVLSEGAGLLIFEELEHARKREARIHAEVVGYGTSSDAGHITQPQENGEGAAAAMRMALQTGGLSPEEVQHVNAHGTSTPLGDIAETIAIKRVFGSHAPRLLISSTKSATGHLLGASGGVEMIACILAIRHKVAPPTLNLENPDPGCDLNYVPRTAREHPIRCALNNSFGFGGHNACLAIRELN